MPWKKNLRKIPDAVLEEVKSLRAKAIRVGCVKRIPVADIRQYRHLGIRWNAQSATAEFRAPLVPKPAAGRYSTMNRSGYSLIRKDLPKVTKTFSAETPNWGDWSKGTHTVDWDREVYQRDHIPPRENEIEIEILGREGATAEVLVFRFTVSEVLEPAARGFKDDLLFNLNVLQENVGAAWVFASTATREDYLKSIYVGWEILPPGERDANIERIISTTDDDEHTRARIRDRYTFLEGLKPNALIQGVGGFRRYFGAKFGNDVVAFENVEYGNAMYVMFRNWEQQSQKSRLELLASGRCGRDFERIAHTTGWKDQVRKVLAEHIR